MTPQGESRNVHGIMPMIKRILLVRWGGLGDLLVALPSIRLLRLGFPEASLTLVGRTEYVSLLLQADVVDQVVGPDDVRVRSLFSDAESAGEGRARWVGGFDLVVSWMNQEKSGVMEPVRERTPGERKRPTICFDARKREPMSVFFYRRTLEATANDLVRRAEYEECARLPLDSIPDDPSFPLSGRQARSKPFAVIHPGSGGEKKRWPVGNFLEIARRLRDSQVDGAFVTGEAEGALERSIETAAGSLSWAWLKSPSLAALARLLGNVDLYLGNDSGITHLAAACGARVLAFFRNDLCEIWRPFADSHLLCADSVDEIRLDSAWSMAAELLCI